MIGRYFDGMNLGENIGGDFGGAIITNPSAKQMLESLYPLLTAYSFFILGFLLYNGFVLYRIANRVGMDKKWLAFVPGGGFYIRMKITETHFFIKILLGIIGFFVLLMLFFLKNPLMLMILYFIMLLITLLVLSICNIMMDFKLYEKFSKPGIIAFAPIFGIGAVARLIMYSIIAFEKE